MRKGDKGTWRRWDYEKGRLKEKETCGLGEKETWGKGDLGN